MKKNYLTKLERLDFTLTPKTTEIIIGLCLGDLYISKRTLCSNPSLRFRQGIVHEDYILHLYELFKEFCSVAPKTQILKPDKRTGKVYSSIYFMTYALPCFKELHELFYVEGKKVVPLNIKELLTPLSLAYWLCDDGAFDKVNRAVRLCTHSFSLEEVNLLINVLETKWNLKCNINKGSGQFVIRISAKSLPALQSLLKDVMPSTMKYKIGL
jgi:hypothetical protein